MGRQFRIRVYGKPRPHPDPVLLAQVVILLGRHLHRQRQGHGLRQQSGHHTGAGETAPVPQRRGKPAQGEPDVNGTPTKTSEGDEAAGGGGSS